METGCLCINGWSGYTETEVEIVGETDRQYKIKAITKTRLAGENRRLDVGEVEYVPKYAIRIKQ